MKKSAPSLWIYAFCFSSFAAFGWWEIGHLTGTAGSVDLASLGAVESAQQCGQERGYLLADLAKVSPVFARTRPAASVDAPPKECVSFIMQNFIPLNSKSVAMAQCRGPKGEELASPTRGADGLGYVPPCVTEPYVNSVYHSLVDVGDCLNIPVKELLPTL